MATDHQKESVSIIDLTDDSLDESITLNAIDKQVVPFIGNKNTRDNNESITSNKNDEQIVPYNGNKNKRDENNGAHSSNLSVVNDNLTLTSDDSNEIVPAIKNDIGNPNVMGNISSRVVGETISEATITKFSIQLMNLGIFLIHSPLIGDFV